MKNLKTWDILGMVLGIVVVVVGIIVLIISAAYSSPQYAFGADFYTDIYEIVNDAVYCLLLLSGIGSVISGLVIFIYFGRKNSKDTIQNNEKIQEEIPNKEKEEEDISKLASGYDSYKPEL